MLINILEIFKAKLSLMVVVASVIGFVLGGANVTFPLIKFLALIIGTFLSSGGAAALNNFIERDYDALMERTKSRPLPANYLSPSFVMAYGVLSVLLGITILALYVNLLTAFLALLSAFLYVVVYTPLKRLTWLNTTIGAIPGALPPLGGYVAAKGIIDLEGILLFLILFLWQHPHFFAIAWIYKDDYKKGGFKMLPCLKNGEKHTVSLVNIFTIALLAVALLPAVLGSLGYIYAVGAFLLTLGFLFSAIYFSINKTISSAHLLMQSSLIYLPLLLILEILDIYI